MIRIKNWSKLQHFKDRTPPWIKLYRDLLDDPGWHELDGETAKLLIGLWLIASEDEDRAGTLPDTRTLAFRMRVEVSRVEKALTRLNHWLVRDDISVTSERYQVGSPETETETKKRQKRMSRQEKISSLDGYSPVALEVVRTLLNAWPSDRPKGGKIDLDPDTACSRVMSILDRHPSLTSEMLIGAGVNYLAKMEGKGDYISALHFFFGPGKGADMPKWETEIRAINHQRSLS